MSALTSIVSLAVALVVGAGLEQWKAAVALLCSCGDAMQQQPDMMSEFVRVLRRQLEQVLIACGMSLLEGGKRVLVFIFVLARVAGGQSSVVDVHAAKTKGRQRHFLCSASMFPCSLTRCACLAGAPRESHASPSTLRVRQ